MNTKQAFIAAAIALVGSSAAFAQSSEADLQFFGANQASATSRADVRAETLKAQAAGSLVTPSEVLAAAVPARSQAPVQAVARTAVQEQARVQARVDTYKDRARIGAGF